jgi:hypothetical protein
MLLYYQELRKLENNFDSLKYLHILQGKNEVTDELARHFISFSKGYQGNRDIPRDSTTKREHNRVTRSHENPLRLADSVYDISLDKGLARGEGCP